MPHNKIRKLQKLVTRFCYPISIQAWHLGSTRGLERVIGEGFSDVIMKFDGQKVEVFRIAEELNLKIKESMLNYVHSDEYLKGVGKYKNKVAQYDKLLQEQNININKIIDQFEKIYYGLVVSYLVSNLWSKELKEKKKNILQACIMYRKASDGIVNRLDNFLFNYLKEKGVSPFITLETLDKKNLNSADSKWMQKGFIFSKNKFFKKSWKEFLKDNNFVYNDKNIDSLNNKKIKGNTAFPGKITGKVKLVFSESDLSKIEAGDVLVSPMTQSNFIDIFPRISAIITDEGGITCHAAIISRELKKPCVIGTKNATQILKDGDKVEVDANNGVIKSID